MRVIGVDYSGAKKESSTWAAQGTLDGDLLVLEQCACIKRAALTELLVETPAPMVAAMDFPFSVPEEFARFWAPSASRMPDLWEAAASVDRQQFKELRDRFVQPRNIHREPQRVTEQCVSGAISPLHTGGPNMLPMTLCGMQMLHVLWRAGCQVPPLPESQGVPNKTLLEIMPGAGLRRFGLPYKGYKRGQGSRAVREDILDGLPAACGPLRITGLDALREKCLDNDDCLDAVVAAILGAMWVFAPDKFDLPSNHPECTPRLMLEGWLYAPK